MTTDESAKSTRITTRAVKNQKFQHLADAKNVTKQETLFNKPINITHIN